MKKKLRALVAIMLIMVMTFGMNLEASAAGVTHNSYIEWRANLPNIDSSTGDRCTGVQAMGVSEEGGSCLYAIKVNEYELGAVLYYFPSTTNWGTYYTYSVYGLNHANGMTVSGNHIYIAAKSEIDDEINNRVVRISRSDITASTAGSSFSVEDENLVIMDVVTIQNGSYIPYQKGFSTITQYKEEGTFIVGRKIVTGTYENYYNGFTTAEVIGNKFVVSTDTDDMFLVENNILKKDSAKQDICYKEGYGLFIGRWNGGGSDTAEGYSPTKNVILWADIDSENSGEYTFNGTTYRCYTPDKIRVNMDEYTESGVTVYEKFEIESIGITERGNMVATFNVIYTDTYYQNFTNNKTDGIASRKDGDAVYKISKYVNGEKLQFTLS